MPLDPYIEQALLNWCTGAAAVTRPTARFVNFESGSPQYSADSAAPVFRSTMSFAAAISAGSASASNNGSVSCSASSVCTIYGWALYNSTSGGSRLVYGTLTASHSLRSGSQAGFAAGGLVITMA